MPSKNEGLEKGLFGDMVVVEPGSQNGSVDWSQFQVGGGRNGQEAKPSGVKKMTKKPRHGWFSRRPQAVSGGGEEPVEQGIGQIVQDISIEPKQGVIVVDNQTKSDDMVQSSIDLTRDWMRNGGDVPLEVWQQGQDAVAKWRRQKNDSNPVTARSVVRGAEVKPESSKPGGIDGIVAEWRQKMHDQQHNVSSVVVPVPESSASELNRPEPKNKETDIGRPVAGERSIERQTTRREENLEVAQRPYDRSEERVRRNLTLYRNHIGSAHGMPRDIDPAEFDAWENWYQSGSYKPGMPWEIWKDRQARHQWLRDHPEPKQTKWVHPVMEQNLQHWAEAEAADQRAANYREGEKDKKKGGFWNWVGSLLEGRSIKDSFTEDEWAEVVAFMKNCPGGRDMTWAYNRQEAEEVMSGNAQHVWEFGLQQRQEQLRKMKQDPYRRSQIEQLEIRYSAYVHVMGRIEQDALAILTELGLDDAYAGYRQMRMRLCAESKILDTYGEYAKNPFTTGGGTGSGPC